MDTLDDVERVDGGAVRVEVGRMAERHGLFELEGTCAHVPGLYSLRTLPIPPQLLPTLNSLLLALVLLPDAIPATDAAKDAVEAADDLRLGVVK